MSTLERTEADYQVRLTDRVREWERRNPTEASALRLVTQQRMGMWSPPEGRIARTALEMEFREAVRVQLKWPDCKAWMEGR